MFKEKDYQQAMNEQGYTIFPFLTELESASLHQLYLDTVKEREFSGMFANHNRNEVDISKYISNEIFNTIQNALDKQFHNYEKFVAHFVVKEANYEHEFALHQDWNVVDESQYDCFHVWIPLRFSSPRNGGMFVVPGSHNYFNNIRSGSFGKPVLPSTEAIQSCTIDLNIPVTEALAWKSATFHGSHPNSSDLRRVSVLAVIHQSKCPTSYYHKNPEKDEVIEYPLSAIDLLENLQFLEKGLVPSNWVPRKIFPYSQMANEDIDAARLLKKCQETENITAINKPIICSRELQQILDEDGYAILPLLDELDLEKAKQVFYNDTDFKNYLEKPRYTSLEFERGEAKRNISKSIEDIIRPKLDHLLQNFKIPIFQFFVKMANSDGGIDLHTDSTLMLNPTIEAHYGLWIPLVDVNRDNGTLLVVKGSHKWFKGVMTSSYSWPFYPYLDQLKLHATALNVKAGEVVIFNNHLIHGSSYNKAAIPRVCIVGRATHQFSSYYSFLQEQEGYISVFKEENGIYLDSKFKGDRTSVENGQKIGEIKQAVFLKEKISFK